MPTNNGNEQHGKRRRKRRRPPKHVREQQRADAQPKHPPEPRPHEPAGDPSLAGYSTAALLLELGRRVGVPEGEHTIVTWIRKTHTEILDWARGSHTAGALTEARACHNILNREIVKWKPQYREATGLMSGTTQDIEQFTR